MKFQIITFVMPNNPEYDCYDLEFLEWDRRTTLVLSNTRELNGELCTG